MVAHCEYKKARVSSSRSTSDLRFLGSLRAIDSLSCLNESFVSNLIPSLPTPFKLPMSPNSPFFLRAMISGLYFFNYSAFLRIFLSQLSQGVTIGGESLAKFQRSLKSWAELFFSGLNYLLIVIGK